MGSVTGMIGRIPILDVQPVIDCGRRPAKAVTGESFEVSAHRLPRRDTRCSARTWSCSDPDGRGQDADPHARARARDGSLRRRGHRRPRSGRWQFHVEAWGDPFAHWYHDAGIKIPRGQDVELMLAEGAVLFDRAARRVLAAGQRRARRRSQRGLRDPAIPPADRLAAAAGGRGHLDRRRLPAARASDPVKGIPRRRARGNGRFTAPGTSSSRRSEGVQIDPMGRREPISGTLRTAAQRLGAIAAMGFDVVYLPPIHPIGYTEGKAATTRSRPGRAIQARHGRSDRPRAVTTPSTLTSVRWRISTLSWRARARTRPGGRARPRAADLTRPPVGQGTSGMVHHQGRRLHCLRGEPAQEIPGHLPSQLRQ